MSLRSSTSSLAEATGLPNRPGVAAAGAGRKPGLARSVGISVALGDSSIPALALLLDLRRSGSSPWWRVDRREAERQLVSVMLVPGARAARATKLSR